MVDEGVDDVAVNVDVLKTWGGVKRRVERRVERVERRGEGDGMSEWRGWVSGEEGMGEVEGMGEWRGGVSVSSGWGERRAERRASEVEAMDAQRTPRV